MFHRWSFVSAVVSAGLWMAPAIAADEKSVLPIYSPWTRFCLDGENGNQTCFIGKDARSSCGQPLGAAVLIEKAGGMKRTLRVTVPTGVLVERGVRMTIDQSEPIVRSFDRCYANGCMADYDGEAELLAQLQNGQMLVLEAIDSANLPIRIALPLADFAKAYDGPPTEPKVIEAFQQRLKERVVPPGCLSK